LRLIAARQLCGDYGIVRPGEEFEAPDADAAMLVKRNLARPCEMSLMDANSSGAPYDGPSYSVIIPSRNVLNLVPCVEALYKLNGERRGIVIDDGPELDPWPEMLNGTVLVPGVKPFIFARNVNLGIDAAGTDDVLLLNDDALLRTQRGFDAVASAAVGHPEFGVISATTNLGGVPEQQPQGTGLREVQRTVAFICVYIPRRVIDLIGALDERFGGRDARGKVIYGWEDNDYCRRVREAGLKLGVHDGCYVDHGALHSTFRGSPRTGGDIEPGRQVYVAKWGDAR
jgi:hypothetical protein